VFQTILTKYHGPTNTKGARVCAYAFAGKMCLPLDYSLSTEENHTNAARALALKLGWRGTYRGGSLPNGEGFAYVCCEGPLDRRSGFDLDGTPN
jgi:hypothetical protein